MKSAIKFVNGKPAIEIDKQFFAPLAYTTYFDECGEYEDFIKSGYRMFFVNVSFTDLPINNVNGFSPFLKGVFEGENEDYSDFDDIVNNIISKCPDALIFPRINIAMPRKWIKNNIYETVETPCGCNRESLYSDKFKTDGAELLKELVLHIRSASYSNRVAGYQLCGGTTQEWIHHDLCGSFSEMGMKKFVEWAKEKYSIENITVPTKEDFCNGIFTEETKMYYEFCNTEHTKTIEYFAKTVKEIINNEQIVGIFYGYNAFVPDTLWGLQGLGEIISSPYIDFFSSPCGYDRNRALGVDWGDMIPVDSLKLHNKLAFIECDIRTNFTKRMQDSRPGMYPDEFYPLIDKDGNKTAWSGPESTELSVSAIRKAFSHQLAKSSGIWWFDMWGGWYRSDDIMEELARLKKLYEEVESKNQGPSMSDVVLFVDEKAYRNLPRGHFGVHRVNEMRLAMGNTGIPFDICMVEDAKDIINKYKAVIFTAFEPSEVGEKATELCQKLGVPYVSTQGRAEPFTVDELRDSLVAKGVHCYNMDGCVVYRTQGFFAIHTVNDTETKIKFPQNTKIKYLWSGELCQTQEITLNVPKHSTEMFLLDMEQ